MNCLINNSIPFFYRKQKNNLNYLGYLPVQVQILVLPDRRLEVQELPQRNLSKIY